MPSLLSVCVQDFLHRSESEVRKITLDDCVEEGNGAAVLLYRLLPLSFAYFGRMIQ